MSTKPHRESAIDARTAAEASELPNVKARELRSANAYDALADRAERIATKAVERRAGEAERRAEAAVGPIDDQV